MGAFKNYLNKRSETKSIRSIGVFYKSDKEGGIALNFSKDNAGPYFDTIRKFYVHSKNSVSAEEKNFDNEADLIAIFRHEVERAIDFIYDYSEVDKSVDPKTKVNWKIDNETLKAVFGLMSGIRGLIKYGVIKEDNWNGFSVMYS